MRISKLACTGVLSRRRVFFDCLCRRRNALFLAVALVAGNLFLPGLPEDPEEAVDLPLLKSNNMSWNAYRIGDGLARYPGAPGCDEFPQSLVCLYLQETRDKNDVTALMRVLDLGHWCRHPCITANLAFVHLRLGDGLCAQYDEPCRGNRTDEPDCWNRERDCWYDPGAETKRYAFSKVWYLTVLEELSLLKDLEGITIVSDKYHWTRTKDPRDGNFSVDDTYLNNVVKFFGARFSNVKLHPQGTPDEDFALLCKSEVFVSGGGGFSSLISEVVRRRGGRVIKPRMSR